MKRSVTTIALFVILAGVSTAAIAVAGSFPSDGKPPPPPAQMQLSSGSNFSWSEAASFTEFSLYALGSEFQGHELADLLRRDDYLTYDAGALEESQGSNYVSFLYGTCTPDDETGCAVPIEVQLWGCLQRLPPLPKIIDGIDVSLVPDETVIVRGAEANFYGDWSRLEFYTDDVAVVIFGGDRQQLLDAANGLYGVNNELGPEDPFPQPTCW